MVQWTCRKIIAIAIILIYAIVIGVFSQDIISISSVVIDSGKPRTVQITTYVNFNQTEGYAGLKNESDVIISMNLTAPHGTLIVDDPITINAIALIKGDKLLTVGQVWVFFPNCLAYPTSYYENEVPIEGVLRFDNEIYTAKNKYPNIDFTVQPNTTFRIITSNQVIWNIDGDYTPKVAVFFFDGSNKTYTPQNTVLHVYPQEQLQQSQTNKVSVIITLALFVFSAVGIASLFFDLWESGQSVCKYEKQTKTENDPATTKQDQTDESKTKCQGEKTQNKNP